MQLSDQIYRQIMWDYTISKEDVEKLLNGEIERAGHYDINSLFVKLLQSLTWFSLIDTLKIELIMKLLTDNNINKIRLKSIRKKYFYVKNRLHEIVQIAG